jgi:serine/threonine-protein phosphatase PP1 catalytic subunit
MSREGGFLAECQRKLNKGIWRTFCRVFTKMPICCIIDRRAFCVHGGLSPSISRISQIEAIDRYIEIPDDGPFSDLVWSDPDNGTYEWGPSDRGATFFWGEKVAREFLFENHLEMIIRGHQVVKNGHEFPFSPDISCVTVFSATCYDEDEDNKGCFMTLSGRNMEFVQLPFLVVRRPKGARRGTALFETDFVNSKKRVRKKRRKVVRSM